MEMKIEVKTFKIKCICDVCGLGEMNPTGVVLTTFPPKYPHICSHCGDDYILDDRYPQLRTEEVT